MEFAIKQLIICFSAKFKLFTYATQNNLENIKNIIANILQYQTKVFANNKYSASLLCKIPFSWKHSSAFRFKYNSLGVVLICPLATQRL